ncbi:MAG: hypothetical protein Fur0027_09740 [Raineya sp.]
MLDILEYKKIYLSSQSVYQFIYLDEKLNIQESCHTLFNLSEQRGISLTEVFPFLENLREAILTEKRVFLPHINLEDTDKLLDFTFFREERFAEKPIVCIIKDIGQSGEENFEVQQLARMAMIENEYLLLQNRNVQLENQLLQAHNRELETSKELKNLFFSKISHELRSPVNGILGLSQIMLEQEKLSPTLQNYVESIFIASKHLRTILDDILDISKLESGKIKFQKNVFALNEVFQHLQLNFLKALEQKQLYLYFQIAPDVPSFLIGDEVRLTQIFYNLISNAIKFTQIGGVKVIVENLEQGETHCLLDFTIADSGRGMNESELSKIFNPYEQVGLPSFSFEELGGTGLGLSVVKQLIELQKGTISVFSEPNKGTTFKFSLPFEVHPKSLTEEQTDEDNYQFVGLKALILDDSDISRFYTLKLLQKLGFEVETCGDGLQALRMLQTTYYDLFISDIKVPNLEGDAVVERFEQGRIHQEKTAVIFATGSVGVRKFKYPVLLKPFSPTQLYRLLQEVIPAEKTSLYGLSYLQKITDNQKDFMSDMINSLLTSIKEDADAIARSVAQKDAQLLYKSVHKVKPMAMLMGSLVWVRVLQILEDACKETNLDWKKISKFEEISAKLALLAYQFFEKQKNAYQ